MNLVFTNAVSGYRKFCASLRIIMGTLMIILVECKQEVVRHKTGYVNDPLEGSPPNNTVCYVLFLP